MSASSDPRTRARTRTRNPRRVSCDMVPRTSSNRWGLTSAPFLVVRVPVVSVYGVLPGGRRTVAAWRLVTVACIELGDR